MYNPLDTRNKDYDKKLINDQELNFHSNKPLSSGYGNCFCFTDGSVCAVITGLLSTTCQTYPLPTLGHMLFKLIKNLEDTEFSKFDLTQAYLHFTLDGETI